MNSVMDNVLSRRHWKTGIRKGAIIKLEVNLHADLDRDWLAIFHRRLELPLLHSFYGLVIQAESQRTAHPDVVGSPVGTHHQPQHTCTLILRTLRFLGIIR